MKWYYSALPLALALVALLFYLRAKRAPKAPHPQTITAPSVGPLVGQALDLRPDPTARFNVFRVCNGRLCLRDVLSYSGNDERLKEQAVEAYRAAAWGGSVYVYEWNQLQAEIQGN